MHHALQYLLARDATQIWHGVSDAQPTPVCAYIPWHYMRWYKQQTDLSRDVLVCLEKRQMESDGADERGEIKS